MDLIDQRAERHEALSAALMQVLSYEDATPSRSGVDASMACALISRHVPDATCHDLHLVCRDAEARLRALLDIVHRLKMWGSKTTHPRGMAARLFETAR